MLKLFGFSTFPSGIKNSGQNEEKQNLSNTPQHPFQLQGVTSEHQTHRQQGCQVQPYAYVRDMSNKFVSHCFDVKFISNKTPCRQFQPVPYKQCHE
jgi:hypothetical protein